MERRAALATLGSGATLLTSGCLSVVVDAPEPVHFELWNKTETAHEVEVTIRDESDDVVLDRRYEIEDNSVGPPGGNVIREEAFTESLNDTVFEAVATLDQRVTRKYHFRVTCNDRGPENLFLAEIIPGREHSITFDQSVCG